jgi:hypothetical protein
MQLEAGGNALVAGSLAEIGDRGGNLEWTVQLLFGAQRVVGNRIVAGGRESGPESRSGRKNIELHRLFAAEDLGRYRRRGRRQGHQWHITRPGGGLTQRFRDRIGALQGDRKSAAERN